MTTATEPVASWLTREGTTYQGRVHSVDEAKGTAKYSYQDRCGRCGGAGGSMAWRFTGWTCYECQGTGIGPVRTERLYKADRLEKLNVAQAKRDAKKAEKAEAARIEKEVELAKKLEAFEAENPGLVEAMEALPGDMFLADLVAKLKTWGSLTGPQVDAAKRSLDRLKAKAEARMASQYVGEVGKRMEFEVTVDHVIHLPALAYGFAPSSIYLCRDAAGNRIVYKGSGNFAGKGETVKVKATVAEHSEYKEEKQTKISRPKVLENKG